MRNSSKIFILVLSLLGILTAMAWMGERQLIKVFVEFDQVAEVDLVLMQTATKLNEIQLAKEVIFEKLSSVAEELAFGHVNAARGQYLADYVKDLARLFDQYTTQTQSQLHRVMNVKGVSGLLKTSFVHLETEAKQYDDILERIFSEVGRGGFELSLEDLDRTNLRQQQLRQSVKTIVQLVALQVDESRQRLYRWQQRADAIFYFSLALTVTLVLLLLVFKENMEQISRQRRDLEKLNQELDRFVHTVSHDIAGPLTTIVGFGAYLESHYASQLDKKGQECISGVRKGGMRLGGMIKDLLELTRISRIRNPYSRVGVQRIIETAIGYCDFMMKQSHADIKIEEGMPNIVCDQIKTTAIFFNLIHNAIKFSPGQRPLITVGWREGPRFWEFYVADKGIGIEAGHHQEIFDIFKRLHPPDEYGGTGIGLTIVKAAVEDQGGSIKVDSKPGQGSIFTFTIPKNLITNRPLY